MSLKNYIAPFFIFLLLSKTVVVEAGALMEFASNGTITEQIFKPNCKLQNPPKQINTSKTNISSN